jgi:hypothetical protein
MAAVLAMEATLVAGAALPLVDGQARREVRIFRLPVRNIQLAHLRDTYQEPVINRSRMADYAEAEDSRFDELDRKHVAYGDRVRENARETFWRAVPGITGC